MSNVIQSGHGAAEFSLRGPRLSWRDAASLQKANKNGHNSTGRRRPIFATAMQPPAPIRV
jgi:hypothetical protein